MVAGLLGKRIDFGMQSRQLRIDRAHHAAGVVAAGRLGVEQHVAQALHQRAQVVLDDAVKLERLARGQPQRVAAVCARKLVELQPLARRADPARQTYARHEGERRLQLLAPALVADVAVVLLIDAEELHQLGVVRRHRRR